MTSGVLSAEGHLFHSARDLCPIAEGPSLVRRVVTFRSGRSSWLAGGFIVRALPIELTTVGSGSKSRLQWRYRGGFSPPSLFSLGGHLNGLCSYVVASRDDMALPEGCQGACAPHAYPLSDEPVDNHSLNQPLTSRTTVRTMRRDTIHGMCRGSSTYPTRGSEWSRM